MIEELTIKAVKDGRTLIIRTKGRINTNTAPKFEEVAKANLEGAGRVILDFTELEYMSSAGIRVVLMIFKEIGRDRKRLIIRNPNTDIAEVLTITGFAERVTIEKKCDVCENTENDTFDTEEDTENEKWGEEPKREKTKTEETEVEQAETAESEECERRCAGGTYPPIQTGRRAGDDRLYLE
jgi:anti-anti-sigma factor